MKAAQHPIRIWLFLFVLVALVARAVLADGIVIPQRAYAIPQIPDQRALIHYLDGTETLVVETSFAGQGTNFAWIVPLPTAPQIQPVSAGLFPTLQTIFQPEIVLSVKPYWITLPAAIVVIWVIGMIRRSPWNALMVALMLLVLAVLILPALGTAKGRASASGPSLASVRVLSRQTAGQFDIVTLKSADPAALVSWLNENGFAAPTNILPTVANYVREGWIFAAARLNCEMVESIPRATHPLSFTFKTNKPVYPLRLTASGSDSCRIDLYVFGPGRAVAPGFEVLRCERPNYDSLSTRPQLESGQLRVRHEELAQLVRHAPIATKLSAVLNSAGMSHDAYLSWRDYWPSGGVRYTKGAALTFSVNAAALSFMTLGLIWWCLCEARATQGLQAQRYGPWLVPVVLAIGVSVYTFCLPRIDPGSMRTTRVGWGDIRSQSFEIALALADELENTNTSLRPARPFTQVELQSLLSTVGREYRNVWSAYPRNHPMTNCFTGEPIRFEASPGNLTLRPANALTNGSESDHTHSYELIWHDVDGAEAITNAVPVLSRKSM